MASASKQNRCEAPVTGRRPTLKGGPYVGVTPGKFFMAGPKCESKSIIY